MKYFSISSVEEAYHQISATTKEKFWGILGILHSIDETVYPNKCYSVETGRLSQYFEDLFRLSDKKVYSGTDEYSFVFSTHWVEIVSQDYLEGRPSIKPILVWAYRNHSFASEIGGAELFNKFLEDYHITKEAAEQLFRISFTDSLSFEDSRYSDTDLLSHLGGSLSSDKTTIKLGGTFAVANPGDLSRGPYFQPLYAALQTLKCLTIYPFNIHDYYDLGNNGSQTYNYGAHTDEMYSVYRPYITAIKSKPFLLLAGISGTGKSRIVRELARACWDVGLEEYEAQRPRNFEMVQVKPNWHDSSELIGYVSRIGVDADGKPCPVFVAGDFLKFIAKAWAEPNVPYFLCLDEMNLAPVEQYFAEYLSVIESRKVNEDGEITTDPIVKKCEERWYHPLAAELARDEATRTRFLKDGICIPQNLIVVGTVNMDETTFSFSRKVLDRAMTIEMNEVDLKGGLSHRHEQIGKLGTAELIGNAVEGVDVYKDNQKACEIAISYLESINVKLEGTPFKIAYRTRNETLLYVVNNLPYNKDKDGNELKQEYVIARALDEITNMKILSRIEGDETKVNSKFLEELDGTIKSGLETICPTLFTDDGYVSVSSSKLDEMKQRLASGYTSFWS